MSGRYRAVLFDLFGTLVRFDGAALPEIEIGGRRIRSTLPCWSELVTQALPDVSVAAFAQAVLAVSQELDRERAATDVEQPSRERFRRALARLGCRDEVAIELAPRCARRHMRAIAGATRFPEAHADLLAAVAARHPVAVITNFDDTATAYEILGAHGILAHARCIVVSEAIGLRKPHPALVRIALQDLDVAADAALMVGDHPREDVGAATAAGVDAAWIDTGRLAPAPGDPVPRHVIQNLTELSRIL